MYMLLDPLYIVMYVLPKSNVMGLILISLPLGIIGAKSDSQNVASKQHSITGTYEKLLAAAEVSSCVSKESWEGRGGEGGGGGRGE